jgi:hypothetical protein
MQGEFQEELQGEAPQQQAGLCGMHLFPASFSCCSFQLLRLLVVNIGF